MKRSGGHRGSHRLFRLRPRPCVHELRGEVHTTRQQWIDCLDANGVPGFTLEEVRA